MEEIWKVIEDSDGHYFISNLGRLKREEYEFVDRANKKQHRNSYVKEKGCLNKRNGYYYYSYCGNKGLHKQVSVHRLVAIHFINNPCPEKYDQVNHLDGNKANNIFSNLEWCNGKLNMEHASEHGLINRTSQKRIEQSKINVKKAQEKVIKSYAKYDKDGNLVGILKGTKHSDDCISVRRLTYKGYTYRSCEILLEKYGEIPTKLNANKSFEAANRKRKKYVEYTANGEVKEYVRLKDLPINREFLWLAFNHNNPDAINGSIWDIVEVDCSTLPRQKPKTKSVSALDDDGNVKFIFNSMKEALNFLNVKGANKFYDSIRLHKKYKGYYWVRIDE